MGATTQKRTLVRRRPPVIKEAFKKMDRKTLEKYCAKFNLGSGSPSTLQSTSKETLATIISDHFTSRPVPSEDEMLQKFLRAIHERKSPKLPGK